MRHVLLSAVMTLRELSRSRFALVLLLTIPTLFYTLVALTSADRDVVFKLASVSEDTLVTVRERSESLVFVGLGTVGLLTSFVAMTLVQKNGDATRRLVLSGFRPGELIIAKVGALACVAVVVSAYACTALPLFFFAPRRLTGTFVGFVVAAFVYGSYGLLIGSVVRRELEGILCVTLLANVDAGWLQNPLYYAEAQNKAIIRFLPAYFPSQVTMVSAFSDCSVQRALACSVLYGCALLAVAVVLFWRRMRVLG